MKYNIAKCLACDTVLWSVNRHDYMTCKCGSLSIDGGIEYRKVSYNDKIPGDKRAFFDEYSLTFTNHVTGEVVIDTLGTMDILCQTLTWGSFGPSGDQPKRTRKLYELDEDHIRAIVRTQYHIDTVYLRSFFHLIDPVSRKALFTKLVFEKPVLPSLRKRARKA